MSEERDILIKAPLFEPLSNFALIWIVKRKILHATGSLIRQMEGWFAVIRLRQFVTMIIDKDPSLGMRGASPPGMQKTLERTCRSFKISPTASPAICRPTAGFSKWSLALATCQSNSPNGEFPGISLRENFHRKTSRSLEIERPGSMLP